MSFEILFPFDIQVIRVIRHDMTWVRPPQRHMERRKSRIFILFWPLSGLVIYSGGFLARGVAWVFIHLFTTGQQASTQGRWVLNSQNLPNPEFPRISPSRWES